MNRHIIENPVTSRPIISLAILFLVALVGCKSNVGSAPSPTGLTSVTALVPDANKSPDSTAGDPHPLPYTPPVNTQFVVAQLPERNTATTLVVGFAGAADTQRGGVTKVFVVDQTKNPTCITSACPAAILATLNIDNGSFQASVPSTDPGDKLLIWTEGDPAVYSKGAVEANSAFVVIQVFYTQFPLNVTALAPFGPFLAVGNKENGVSIFYYLELAQWNPGDPPLKKTRRLTVGDGLISNSVSNLRATSDADLWVMNDLGITGVSQIHWDTKTNSLSARERKSFSITNPAPFTSGNRPLNVIQKISRGRPSLEKNADLWLADSWGNLIDIHSTSFGLDKLEGESYSTPEPVIGVLDASDPKGDGTIWFGLGWAAVGRTISKLTIGVTPMGVFTQYTLPGAVTNEITGEIGTLNGVLDNLRVDSNGDVWFSTIQGTWTFSSASRNAIFRLKIDESGTASFDTFSLDEAVRTSMAGHFDPDAEFNAVQGPVCFGSSSSIFQTQYETYPSSFPFFRSMQLSVPGLSYLGLSALHCKASGNTWAGTNKGLVKISSSAATILYPTTTGLPNSGIKSLFSLSNSRLLVGTIGGLSVMTIDNKSGSLDISYSTTVFEGADHPIGQVRSVIPSAMAGSNYYVTAGTLGLAPQNDGINGGKGLETIGIKNPSGGGYYIYETTPLFTTLASSNQIAPIGYSYFWLGKSNGVELRMSLNDNLSTRIPNAPSMIYSFDGSSGYRGGYVNTVSENNSGLWIGGYSGLVQLTAPGSLSVTADGNPNCTDVPNVPGPINSIISDGAAGIWVGGVDGVRHCFDSGNPTSDAVIPPTECFDQNGDPVPCGPVCTRPSSVVCSDPIHFGTSYYENTVSSLYLDSEGTLWAGTPESVSAGLRRIAQAAGSATPSIKHLGFESGLPSLKVRAITGGPNGSIWVGTDNGLALLSR